MTSFRKIFAAVALCAPLASFAAPSATNLDPLFAVTPDSNVFESTTVRHVTTQAVLSGVNDVAWYSFSGLAGQRLFVDHDDAINDDTLTDSVLSLFDGNGQLLAMGDDSTRDPGSYDTGSVTPNGFLGVYTLPTSGVYYLALSSWGNGADVTGCSVTEQLRQPVTGAVSSEQYTGCSAVFAFTNGGTAEGSVTLHVSLGDSATAVPEPGSLALAGLALAGLVVRRRRR